MFRYIGLVWDETDLTSAGIVRVITEQLTKAPWIPGLQAPGLRVWHTGGEGGPSRVYRLADSGGLILGTLFRRSPNAASAPAPLAFTEVETRRILLEAGRPLVTDYWGSYVALLRNPTTGIRWVLRDPTATLPCFTVKQGGVQLYFSCLDDYRAIGPRRPTTLNWDFIAHSLCTPGGARTGETGFREIREVLGGECLEACRHTVRHNTYWDPVRIAQTSPVEDSTTAVALLRETTLDVAHAWAAILSSILHALSGGWDSSLLLACVRSAPTDAQIACLNYYSHGANEDERPYAEAVARAFGCSLISQPRDPELSLEGIWKMRPSPLPLKGAFYFLEAAQAEGHWARQYGATTITSGFGGDQLFRQTGPFAAADFARRHGIRPEFFRVSMHQARMEHESLWRILRHATTDWMTRSAWDPADLVGAFRSLILPEAIAAAKTRARAMSRFSGANAPGRPTTLGRGKMLQIAELAIPPLFHNPFGARSDPERRAPLYSQPLIDACLRIPIYQHVDGGQPRALIRRAFRDDLPHAVVHRHGKGGFDAHAKRVLLRHLSFARELLLDGYLVRERILDRHALMPALADDATRAGASTAELFEYIGVEAWIQSALRWGLDTRAP
jgi:asparagine synthase (glutamine-hydrolysing)